MTIDERIERLVERHEALAQSVELLASTVHEQTAAIVGQGGQISEQSKNIDKLLAKANKDGENIAALARIAEAHEHRLTDLEEGLSSS